MRRLIWLAGLLLLAGPPVGAQEYPRGELYGGYSFLRTGNDNATKSFQLNAANNANSVFGMVGDFSAAFKGSLTLLTYGAGARVSARAESVTGYAHFLVGGLTLLNGSRNDGKMMLLGIGLDVNLSHRVAFRLQGDWMPAKLFGVWTKENFRFGSGFVLRLGRAGGEPEPPPSPTP